MAILVILGYLFCIVPGVWLWVVLMPFEMILMIENETFLGAWERCFTIIKEHFWNSLAIYLIAYLIYMCTAGIIGGLMSLLTGVFTYFTTKDISTTIGIITSILNIFSFVFFIVFYISAILNYFSLTEAYDSTGLMRKLNNLGGNHTSTNIEEQY
jgi:ABC-type dipeptide/oligopeptide/nickel transport system permease component